jgi:hypothetical protein
MVAVQPSLFRQTQCKRCLCSFELSGRRGPTPTFCSKCRAEIGSTRIHKVDCKQCGRTAWKGTPQEFCSQACHHAWQADHAHTQPCKQCGKHFKCSDSDAHNGRSYCSTECRKKAWGQDDTRECVVCNARFRRRRNSKDKNLCCSKQCGGKLRKIKAAAASGLKRVARIVGRLQRRFRRNIRCLVRVKDRARRESHPRECVRCGKLFKNGKDRLCSPECRAESRRINKRRGKKSGRKGRDHVTRCKEKGLPYEHGITKHWVEQRDNGCCLLCGKKTVPSDSRLAPTIGHIVPLNNPLNRKHGHVQNNLYLNCARCNGRQGNAVVIDGHQNYEDPRAVFIDKIRVLGYPLETNRTVAESPMPPTHEFPTN